MQPSARTGANQRGERACARSTKRVKRSCLGGGTKTGGGVGAPGSTTVVTKSPYTERAGQRFGQVSALGRRDRGQAQPARQPAQLDGCQPASRRSSTARAAAVAAGSM